MSGKTLSDASAVLIYDSASGHFSHSGYPSSLPIEQAYVHIGFFMGWIIDNNLYSDYFEEEFDLQILRFKARTVSPGIISGLWNGKLTDRLLSPTGNRFANYYYAGGLYEKDYRQLLAGGLPGMYHVADSKANYLKMNSKITSRFEEWKQQNA